MFRQRVREGAWSGVIAAAATAGVLVGFGRVRGSPFGPLNAVAHLVLGERVRLADGFDALVTGVALLAHGASVIAWGILFALVAARVRGPLLFPVALLVGTGAFLVDYHLLPTRFRPGFESVLTAGELAAIYVALALSLALGLAAARGRADGPSDLA